MCVKVVVFIETFRYYLWIRLSHCILVRSSCKVSQMAKKRSVILFLKLTSIFALIWPKIIKLKDNVNLSSGSMEEKTTTTNINKIERNWRTHEKIDTMLLSKRLEFTQTHNTNKNKIDRSRNSHKSGMEKSEGSTWYGGRRLRELHPNWM